MRTENQSLRDPYPAVLGAYASLAALSSRMPALGIAQLLLRGQALTTAAAIVSSCYWSSPVVAAAAAAPDGEGLRCTTAARLSLVLLELLLQPAASPSASCGECSGAGGPGGAGAGRHPLAGDGATVLLQTSCSDECLATLRLSPGLDNGCVPDAVSYPTLPLPTKREV